MNTKELEDTFVAHVYHPLPVVITKGKGVWLWDEEGHKYLDMLSAYSAVSHGHCHPKLVRALKEQLKKVAVVSRAFYGETLGAFMRKLCEMSGFEMGIPMNTGAEAVETAIKAARLWGFEKKGIKEPEIIVANDNFHGRTTTIISFSSEPKYKKGFGPFTPGFTLIPYGDARALEEAIGPNTCAFMIEPIQGEAGVIIPPPGYLKQVAEICKRKGILFIVDEIQSGLGRSGKMFAFQHQHVQPDGLILGKALGGGLLPVSAFLANKEVLALFKPGMHGSTFGGNPLAAAVGLEALNVLEKEKLAEKSEKQGAYFLKQLRSMNCPLFKEVRGKGLWIGVEVDPQKANARMLCEKLKEKGILAKETHEVTIRFAPPLVIKRQEIDWALDVIKAVVS